MTEALPNLTLTEAKELLALEPDYDTEEFAIILLPIPATEMSLSMAVESFNSADLCEKCGACCRLCSKGVRVEEKDVARMATYLDMAKLAFEQKYLARHEDGILHLEVPCTFQKDNQCFIHEARPKKCRTFPFGVLQVNPSQHWLDGKNNIGVFNCPGGNNFLKRIASLRLANKSFPQWNTEQVKFTLLLGVVEPCQQTGLPAEAVFCEVGVVVGV